LLAVFLGIAVLVALVQADADNSHSESADESKSADLSNDAAHTDQANSADADELLNMDLLQDTTGYGRRRRRRRRTLSVGFVHGKVERIDTGELPKAFSQQIQDQHRGEMKYDMRPNWVTTERCNSAKCVPCDAGDGCFVFSKTGREESSLLQDTAEGTAANSGDKEELLQDKATYGRRRRRRRRLPPKWAPHYGAYTLRASAGSDMTRSVYKVCLLLDEPTAEEALLQTEDSASVSGRRRRRRRRHLHYTPPPTPPPPQAHVTFGVNGQNGAFKATWNGRPVALPRECTDGKGRDCIFHSAIVGDKGLNTFKLIFKPFRRGSEQSLLQSGARTKGAALLKSFDATKEKSKSRSWAKAKAKACHLAHT
jgi:hypothetical protein